jgi:hypothetical protein
MQKPRIIKQGIIDSVDILGELHLIDFHRCNGLWGGITL